MSKAKLTAIALLCLVIACAAELQAGSKLVLSSTTYSAYSAAEASTVYANVTAPTYTIPDFASYWVRPDLLVQSYTNFPTTPISPLSGIGGFTICSTHSANGTVIDRLRVATGQGFIQVAVSPSESYPLIAASSYLSIGLPGVPRTPYLLTVYTYNANGSINHTAKSVLDWSSLATNPISPTTTTYTGGSAFITGTGYLVYTLTLSDASGVPTGQAIGIVQISADGSTITPIVQVAAPLSPNYFMYTQPNIVSLATSTGYDLIIGFGGFVPNVLGAFTNAAVVSYRFNVAAKTLVQTGIQYLPGLIEGIAFNDLDNSLVILTDPATSGASLWSNPTAPFNNGCQQPSSNFRLYIYLPVGSNYLRFVDGSNLATNTFSAHWVDSDALVMTVSDKYSLTGYYGYLSLFTPPVVSAAGPAVANGASSLRLYRYFPLLKKFALVDAQPVAPYAANIAVTGSKVAVTGQDTPLMRGLSIFTVQ